MNASLVEGKVEKNEIQLCEFRRANSEFSTWLSKCELCIYMAASGKKSFLPPPSGYA